MITLDSYGMFEIVDPRLGHLVAGGLTVSEGDVTVTVYTTEKPDYYTENKYCVGIDPTGGGRANGNNNMCVLANVRC